MKNAFHFTEKAPFVLEILTLLHFPPSLSHVSIIAESIGETHWRKILSSRIIMDLNSNLKTWIVEDITNKIFWNKIRELKDDYQKSSKNLTSFFLNLASFSENYRENQKGPGTSYQPLFWLPIMLRSFHSSVFHHLATFDALIQWGFSVV